MSGLKTLKDMKYIPTKSEDCIFKDKLYSEEDLKAEATKRVISCCPVAGYNIPQRKYERCSACERDIWVNNLTEADLKEGVGNE